MSILISFINSLTKNSELLNETSKINLSSSILSLFLITKFYSRELKIKIHVRSNRSIQT